MVHYFTRDHSSRSSYDTIFIITIHHREREVVCNHNAEVESKPSSPFSLSYGNNELQLISSNCSVLSVFSIKKTRQYNLDESRCCCCWINSNSNKQHRKWNAKMNFVWILQICFGILNTKWRVKKSIKCSHSNDSRELASLAGNDV